VNETHPLLRATAALAGVPIGGPSAGDLTIATARAINDLERAGLLRYRDTFAPQATPTSAGVAGGRRVALLVWRALISLSPHVLSFCVRATGRDEIAAAPCAQRSR
jgi:hypothetical protein